jgi:hypothetical protein
MEQAAYDQQLKNERQTGKQRTDALTKYRHDLQDAMDYSEYLKQQERDKEAEMNKAHLRYIASEKAKQDQDNDKYYKFFKDFDARMNDRLDDYNKYKVPELQRQADRQRQLEMDLERRQQAEDARRASEEQEKARQQMRANQENAQIKRAHMTEAQRQKQAEQDEKDAKSREMLALQMEERRKQDQEV